MIVLKTAAPMQEFPKWKTDRCEWCKKHKPLSGHEAKRPYHYTIGYHCNAPNHEDYIIELEARIAELEARIAELEES